MRRSERECSDSRFMDSVLDDAFLVTLGINTGGAPYVVPFNFVYLNGAIYIHCAREGRKLELIKADPRVGFNVVAEPFVEGTTTRYRSVIGEGTVIFVEDLQEKDTVLRALAAKYDAPCKFPVSDAKMAATQLLRIEISTMCGKHSHAAEPPRPVPHYTE